MKYIFWDIDGTLLLTGLAGADALRAAIRELFGVENFPVFASAGRRNGFADYQANLY